MSIENLANPESVMIAGEIPPDQCWFCGDPLTSPAVYWQACGGSIALHPDCAKDLGAKLMFDGERATWIAKHKPLSHGIDHSL